MIDMLTGPVYGRAWGLVDVGHGPPRGHHAATDRADSPPDNDRFRSIGECAVGPCVVFAER
jgi:hypothetical protein